MKRDRKKMNVEVLLFFLFHFPNKVGFSVRRFCVSAIDIWLWLTHSDITRMTRPDQRKVIKTQHYSSRIDSINALENLKLSLQEIFMTKKIS